MGGMTNSNYAGRLELIKSVIGGMTNFWSQIFIVHKKVIRTMEIRAFVVHFFGQERMFLVKKLM